MKPRLDFYGALALSNQLVFDIGANAGNYTLLFRKVGALVVAVEPQAALAAALEARFSNAADVSVVRAAVGSVASIGILRKTPSLSEVASMHPEIVERSRFSSEHSYCLTEEVPVVTLESLISDYGIPVFIKIDVEGYELEALKGLTTPIKLISIEFNREFWPETRSCLQLLERKNGYRFNYTLGDIPVFKSPNWLSSHGLESILGSVDDPLLWGDIYARI